MLIICGVGLLFRDQIGAAAGVLTSVGTVIGALLRIRIPSRKDGGGDTPTSPQKVQIEVVDHSSGRAA